MGKAKKRKKSDSNYGKSKFLTAWDFVQKEKIKKGEKILFCGPNLPPKYFDPEGEADMALVQACDYTKQIVICSPVKETKEFMADLASGKYDTPFALTIISKEEAQQIIISNK